MRKPHEFRRSRAKRRPVVSGEGSGFTLIELLAVIAVMVLMFTLVTPALRPLLQSRGRVAALADLEQGVELARTHARTGKGYVWMAMMNTTRNGRTGVVYTIFGSRDGSSQATTANVQALTAPRFMPDVSLVPLAQIDSSVSSSLPSDAVDAVSQGERFPVDAGVNEYSQGTESYTLTFTPGGEVLLPIASTPVTPYDSYLALPLASTPGGQAATGSLDAVLLIEGGSGQVRRIQL